LTPAAERGTGMVKKAEELAAKHGWFLARQFENPANPEYHRNSTGPEILSDFAGARLDYWVTGYGTGGTMTGAGEVIKLARPDTKIIATEPAAASLLAGDEWSPHKIQGWTPDFIPEVLNRDVFDELLPVTDEVAIETARALAIDEGIFAGISSGATLAAALQVAETADKGSVILAMLPDTGERYLSKVFNDEWMKENRLLERFDPTVREVLEHGNGELPSLLTVTESTLLREAINLVQEYSVSQIPVLRGKENVGVLHEAKLLRSVIEDSKVLEQTSGEVMDAPLPEISVQETTDRVRQHLGQRDAAVLVRDGDTLVGILTRYDLVDFIL